MSDSAPGSAQPLGVSSIISETFSVFSKCFLPCFIAALVPSLIIALIALVFVGSGVILGDPDTIDPASVGTGVAFVTLLGLIAGSVATAVIVRIVYDAKMGKPVDIGSAISAALPLLLPIVVLSIASALIMGVGFAVFIIPGIWLAGALAVVMPAIVVDKAGFGALGRSFQLTKGYRWPIVGVLFIMLVVLILAQLVLSLVTAAFAAISPFLAVFVDASLNAVPQALYSVAPVLIYARLREIKEGLGIEDVAKVFD
ncbi:MAG: hypothetical protein AAF577_09185 [Pseudomonadota bacterium]